MTDDIGKIHYRSADAVAWLGIDNVKRRNALTLDMWEQLADRLGEIDADPAINVAVISGVDSSAFASGADLKEMKDRVMLTDGMPRLNAASARLWQALNDFNKPLIASIRGFCFGAGVAIASKSDLRIAGRSAKFCVPAGKIGLAYPLDLVRDLVLLVGPARAKTILFTARVYDAAQAQAIDLVEEVLDDDQVEARVAELAATIAAGAPLTARATKSAVRHVSGRVPDPARAQADVALCGASADYREGLAAFAEKRTPRFSGR